jgi:hypothetical protein
MITIGRIMSRSGARGSGGLPRAPPLSRRRTLPTPGDDGGHRCIIMMMLDRQGGRTSRRVARGSLAWVHRWVHGGRKVAHLQGRFDSYAALHVVALGPCRLCVRLHNRGRRRLARGGHPTQRHRVARGLLARPHRCALPVRRHRRGPQRDGAGAADRRRARAPAPAAASLRAPARVSRTEAVPVVARPPHRLAHDG